MIRYALLTMLTGTIVAGVTAANWVRSASEVVLDWNLLADLPETVQLERPTKVRIIRSISAPGVVEPVRVIHVNARRAGQVAEVLVSEGDDVVIDQALVRLDDEGSAERLELARSRLESLRAEIVALEGSSQAAQTDLAPNRRFVGLGSTPPQSLENDSPRSEPVREAQEAKRAEFKSVGQEIQGLETLLDASTIRATAAGVVDSVAIRPRDPVTPALAGGPGLPLMKLLDLTSLRVVAMVDEADAHLVKPGQSARIAPQSAPESMVEGRVERVARRGVLNGDVVGFQATLTLDGSHERIQVGMRASVDIEVQEVSEALSVPIQAVVHRRLRDLPDSPAVRSWSERAYGSRAARPLDPALQYLKTIFVVENGVARVRPVETGISDRRRVEIVWGLDVDDEVVVGPFRALDELHDSSPIVPDESASPVEGS